MVHELTDWERAAFLTLTYREDALPADGGVDVGELQRFLKRLRKKLGARRIRYYACGEYGEKYSRPHYHLIVFGLGLDERDLVQECWPYGFVYVGSVTTDSVQYVAGYIHGALKKRPVVYPRPPFHVMSKGLGRDFAVRNAEQFRQKMQMTLNGVKMGLPRYYRQKLGITAEELAPHLLKRKEEAHEVLAKLCENDEEAYERVKDARRRQAAEYFAKHKMRDRGVM